jgi:hypothetical protein
MLVATKEDFDNAFELFKTVAVQQVTKLGEKERNLAYVIRDNTPCDIPTLMDGTGLSNTYIYELLHGDKNSGNRGMLEKIPELKLFSRRDINPDTGYPWGRNHYALPSDWKLVSSSESILWWDDGATDEDQLRAISDNFAYEFRSSGETGEELDSSLGGDNGDIVYDNNNCFGTSEECKPPFGISPSASCRSSEKLSTTNRLSS